MTVQVSYTYAKCKNQFNVTIKLGVHFSHESNPLRVISGILQMCKLEDYKKYCYWSHWFLLLAS